MRPTDEQIKQAAEKYLKQLHTGMWDNNLNVMEDFAKSLFKETEEETWERMYNNPVYSEKTSLEFAIEFHKERTRIENETT